jgi:hypothetical protein
MNQRGFRKLATSAGRAQFEARALRCSASSLAPDTAINSTIQETRISFSARPRKSPVFLSLVEI